MGSGKRRTSLGHELLHFFLDVHSLFSVDKQSSLDESDSKLIIITDTQMSRLHVSYSLNSFEVLPRGFYRGGL